MTQPIVLPPLPEFPREIHHTDLLRDPPIPQVHGHPDAFRKWAQDYARAAVQAERERIEAELVQMGRTL